MSKKDNQEVEGEICFKERKRWVFLGLPFTFTKYTIKADMITIDKGLLKTTEDDCYMYKVQDVKHTATLFEKIVKIGTVTCYTGDTTDPVLVLSHIKHSKDIKNYIFQASEEARIKRRTMNMLDISAQGDGNIDHLDGADIL